MAQKQFTLMAKATTEFTHKEINGGFGLYEGTIVATKQGPKFKTHHGTVVAHLDARRIFNVRGGVSPAAFEGGHVHVGDRVKVSIDYYDAAAQKYKPHPVAGATPCVRALIRVERPEV